MTAPVARRGFSEEAIHALNERRGEPAWMQERRLDAWKIYENLPMPTRLDEEWRRTDLRDQRMTIMLTQAVASPPTEAEISALRAKVKALHELNVSAAALNDLIAAALEIAAS